MRHFLFILSIPLGLTVLSCLYYFLSFSVQLETVFLSISTFLFSIFTGFFISRQAARFNKVREVVTMFDGKLTSIYRTSGHISNEMQHEAGVIISAHYKRILESRKWDIHFAASKSITLISLHRLLDTHIGKEKVESLQNQTIGVLLKSLIGCQDLRKQMIALREEKIPLEQSLLIIIFAAMLLVMMSTIPSAGIWVSSILKAAFVVSVFSVLVILYRLDNLVYSEKIMGKRSALDVLGIIDGTH